MTNGEKFREIFGFGADGSRVIAVNAIWWDCQFQDSKPFTNADRIRSMTDEELARFMGNVDYDPWQRCDQCKWESCEDCCLEWLKQEANDEEIQP